MATMWYTSGGNSPERLSGAAMDSPSRMASRDWSMTSASRVLATTLRTMSSAVSSGTPLCSRVESVRAKRATAIWRMMDPNTGAVSLNRSQRARPSGADFQRTKTQTARARTARMAHQ